MEGEPRRQIWVGSLGGEFWDSPSMGEIIPDSITEGSGGKAREYLL